MIQNTHVAPTPYFGLIPTCESCDQRCNRHKLGSTNTCRIPLSRIIFPVFGLTLQVLQISPVGDLNSGLCLENKWLLAKLISVFLNEIKWRNSLNKAEQ